MIPYIVLEICNNPLRGILLNFEGAKGIFQSRQTKYSGDVRRKPSWKINNVNIKSVNESIDNIVKLDQLYSFLVK